MKALFDRLQRDDGETYADYIERLERRLDEVQVFSELTTNMRVIAPGLASEYRLDGADYLWRLYGDDGALIDEQGRLNVPAAMEAARDLVASHPAMQRRNGTASR